MNKADRVYFEDFNKMAEHCCSAADYLVRCLNDYSLQNITEMLQTMHEYETTADKKKDEMYTALARAFVTPVDREDMAVISHNIDEVTDTVEEILQCFYMDKIEQVQPSALQFAKRLLECCNLMRIMINEFINFKKPAKLYNLIADLKRYQEDCEHFYLDAVGDIPKYCSDVLQIVYWREIYAKMMYCAVACEHVGDSIELTVIKNT